jgi:hypothetical protein
MQELPETVFCVLYNLGQSALRDLQFGFTLNGRARFSVNHRLGPEANRGDTEMGCVRSVVVEDPQPELFAR